MPIASPKDTAQQRRQQPDSPGQEKPRSASPNLPSVSAERLSDLIGRIYDCVLDPANWESLLQAVCHELSFMNGALGILPSRGGSHLLLVNTGFDPEWTSAAGNGDYMAESMRLWGGERHISQLPLDEPLLGTQAPGYAAREANKYYRDILEPRNVLESAIIMLAREPAFLGYVALNRHRSAGPLTEGELAGLRLLGPHFRRAVTISNLFDLKAIEAASFSAVLEGLAFGVVLVDETLGLVHANAAAQTMLAEHDPIRLERGILTLSLDAAQTALAQAVQQGAIDEARLGVRGIGIPARRKKGEPCVIHVLPLRHGRVRSDLAQRATAALFIAPRTIEPSLPADALTLFYNLTPAECRVCEMICAGMTQEAIGRSLGIAPSTVKTHLLHVFDKTGTKRQVDLVKLATSLSLPI